jgi:hypothetical protein
MKCSEMMQGRWLQSTVNLADTPELNTPKWKIQCFTTSLCSPLEARGAEWGHSPLLRTRHGSISTRAKASVVSTAHRSGTACPTVSLAHSSNTSSMARPQGLCTCSALFSIHVRLASSSPSLARMLPLSDTPSTMATGFPLPPSLSPPLSL